MGDFMVPFEELKTIMKKRLKRSRYKHTLGVVEAAKSLALDHDVNVNQAALAALLHDYGKNLSSSELCERVDEFGIELDSITKKNLSLVHGEVGAALVCKELGLCDEDVLNAIRYHTYGRVNMSDLEKVIYIADAIEPGRDYDGVEELRVLATQDLDKALRRAVSDSIQFVVQKGHMLHLNTIELWNAIITDEL